MANGDLAALHAFTKDLAGSVHATISELDQRCATTTDDLGQQFVDAKEAITAIADSYEGKIEELILAVEKATSDLITRTGNFDAANGKLEKGLAALGGAVETGNQEIAGDAGTVDAQADQLEQAAANLHQLIHTESAQSFAELDAHHTAVAAMIEKTNQALDAFSATSRSELAQASTAFDGLDQTATTLLDQTADFLGHKGDQGFSLLSGETGSLIETAMGQGQQVMGVANQVLDQTGVLSGDFIGAVDQVTAVLENLITLVDALGPLVALADEL
jgi:hypothetical protein